MPLDGATLSRPLRPNAAVAVGALGDLGAAVQRGEARAFAILWQRERGRLTALARRMTRNADDADDVVQEAFLSAWRHHARFQCLSQPSTWLYRITANAALMHLRRQRRQPAERLTSVSGDILASLELRTALDRPGPEQFLRATEKRQALQGALARLPPAERALMGEAWDDGDAAAVANRHMLTRAALKSRLYRTRQTLRGLLEAATRADDDGHAGNRVSGVPAVRRRWPAPAAAL